MALFSSGWQGAEGRDARVQEDQGQAPDQERGLAQPEGQDRRPDQADARQRRGIRSLQPMLSQCVKI